MSEVLVETSPETVVSAVLRQLNEGQIESAASSFTADFHFEDHGIDLEFTDKDRLTEFFRKARELYPDYFVRANRIFVSGEDVIIQWTLQVTFNEPFYAGLTRSIPISLPGVSIVQINNGKIAEWADYYDGLTARRTALGAHFAEWIEY